MVHNTQRIQGFNQELQESIEQARADLSATLASEHQLALTNSRLQERLQLARDLHDGLGGQLVRSIIQVEQARRPLENQQFLSMLKLLRNDLRQVVDSSAGENITTPPTPEIWLAPLRHRFTNLLDELNISLDWHLPSSWASPPSALHCLLLARVIEEALTNVLKHSQASQVNVGLNLDIPNQLQLWVEDNGIGFEPQQIKASSLGVGLSSIQARIQRLKGTLHLESQPGKTRLSATLPI